MLIIKTQPYWLKPGFVSEKDHKELQRLKRQWMHITGLNPTKQHVLSLLPHFVFFDVTSLNNWCNAISQVSIPCANTKKTSALLAVLPKSSLSKANKLTQRFKTKKRLRNHH
ncbi:hypothetical protein CAL7716_053460 [Calothrix sp. PCC 7716]|nr:hypothetical protein CAL7716_053460 [Calothrix sp. PCC 7716]